MGGSEQEPLRVILVKEEKVWYKQWWGVLIALLILPFFLLWYIWAKSKLSPTVKVILTFLLIGVIGSASDSAKNQTTNSTNQALQTQAANPTDKPYEVVRQWDTGNGQGMLVVLANPNITDANLRALGERLRADFAANDTSFVHVYTSRDAALIYRDQILQPGVSQDILDKHKQAYVAQYFKNRATGLNKFTILTGALRNEVPIEINY